ncbi:DJ-1/PfpI family protein [Sphingomonas sp. RB3P16]|uniref:DJ-1/PfpI family protein n=1 Tax=Parasphingomonas frigoris TaxID=3096163 RepID=UPI002FC730AF
MFHLTLARNRLGLVAAACLVAGCGSVAAGQPSNPPQPNMSAVAQAPIEHILPYQARFGRQRPVIAIVGINAGTELTDYVIPYGILQQAAVGEVITVATGAGMMTMRPALRIQPQASVAEFDRRFPEGADYVVVPAVVRHDDPVLLSWVKQQAAKGGTLVSICDGALVLASSGVLDGHRATAHWATAGYRRKTYPQVRWVDDRRYVADGRIVSSAGISAAVPTSLALVEAIAGRDRAAATAAIIGAPDWSAAHDSHRFAPKFGRNLSAFAATEYFNGWFHHPQSIGVTISPGVDEIAVAFTADAYARTGRAKAYAFAPNPSPVTTLHGLTLLPDRTDPNALTRIVTPSSGTSAFTLDRVLAEIARLYGRQTAYGVALGFEYPGYHG